MRVADPVQTFIMEIGRPDFRDLLLGQELDTFLTFPQVYPGEWICLDEPVVNTELNDSLNLLTVSVHGHIVQILVQCRLVIKDDCMGDGRHRFSR